MKTRRRLPQKIVATLGVSLLALAGTTSVYASEVSTIAAVDGREVEITTSVDEDSQQFAQELANMKLNVSYEVNGDPVGETVKLSANDSTILSGFETGDEVDVNVNIEDGSLSVDGCFATKTYSINGGEYQAYLFPIEIGDSPTTINVKLSQDCDPVDVDIAYAEFSDPDNIIADEAPFTISWKGFNYGETQPRFDTYA